MAAGAISQALFERATKVIPGGVNSPVRAFRSVGGTPPFIASGTGPYVVDAEGKEYIDFVGSWGPLVLGHRPRVVLEAIETVLERGTSFGAPTDLEVELAETLIELIPALDMVRMVNSGTEATMSAARLARGYTGRDILVKFNGCYHGHADSFLVEAGSGVATCGISGSPGVPAEVAALTVSVEYNSIDAFRETIRAVGEDRIAAVIVEPVAGNMGLVLPDEQFLQTLRDETSRIGAVLIFDEVMTGFRVALRGASDRFQVTPDLLTFGKVIGGGLPVGAFGGKKEIMSHLAPSGPVYQAGTLSGNPLAMAAGLAMLSELRRTNPYPELEETATRLVQGWKQAADEASIALQVNVCGSMFGLFFSETPVKNFTDARAANGERFKKFFHAMLDAGVYIAPSAFEAGFVSTTHDSECIDKAIAAGAQALRVL